MRACVRACVYVRKLARARARVFACVRVCVLEWACVFVRARVRPRVSLSIFVSVPAAYERTYARIQTGASCQHAMCCQEWPKRCGHTDDVRVIPRDEAISKISAAVAARDEGPLRSAVLGRPIRLLLAIRLRIDSIRDRLSP